MTVLHVVNWSNFSHIRPLWPNEGSHCADAVYILHGMRDGVVSVAWPLKVIQGISPESQGQNLALTVLYVLYVPYACLVCATIGLVRATSGLVCAMLGLACAMCHIRSTADTGHIHARLLVGVSQKSIFKRPCQFLAINAHKMAPITGRWLQERGRDAPT